MRIAIIGAYEHTVSQMAINRSLEYLANELDYKIEYTWIATTTLEDNP
jgi:CTP synthase (UTP-ammonia lyase)